MFRFIETIIRWKKYKLCITAKLTKLQHQHVYTRLNLLTIQAGRRKYLSVSRSFTDFLSWLGSTFFRVMTSRHWVSGSRYVGGKRFSETSRDANLAAQRHIPEDLFLSNTAFIPSHIARIHTHLNSGLGFPTAYKDADFDFDLILAKF
jgi:hypothetical protein